MGCKYMLPSIDSTTQVNNMIWNYNHGQTVACADCFKPSHRVQHDVWVTGNPVVVVKYYCWTENNTSIRQRKPIRWIVQN